ncbi:FAD-dependent monooxygenase [Plantactinospora sp. GCM10030261]|uniref:FAD-dependent monooxygenase n=1 Tax=Plantactinospora sp. GCM10030261 TaxID=3273420 RepID=UPI0036128D4C
MTRTVGIIGAGIGGLAMAITMHRAGWKVRVYERSVEPELIGTALGIWPEALRALDTIDLGDVVRTQGAEQKAGVFLRPDGSRIGTIDVPKVTRRTGDTVRLISRAGLLDLLTRAMPADIVRYGVTADVTDLRKRYDVVVAADGINSRTRTTLFGAEAGLRYVGMTAWRGTVEGSTNTVSETWGAGRKFGITPRESGRTNWYATAIAPAGGRRPGAELDEIRARFGGWHDGVRQVLAGIREEEVLRHDVYDLARPLPSFVAGTVALIGDAAHAMAPDIGRGACEALIDAAVLGECLVEAPSVADGLATYDRRRRPSTQRLTRAARVLNRMARVRRLVPARDLAIRTALLVS